MQRAHRLRRRADFSHVLRRGARVTTPEFVLHYAGRNDTGPARIGFSVSKRIGGAVARNRARRLLREAVRPLTGRLTACDIVLSARPSINAMTGGDLRSAVADAATRAGLVLSDT